MPPGTPKTEKASDVSEKGGDVFEAEEVWPFYLAILIIVVVILLLVCLLFYSLFRPYSVKRGTGSNVRETA